MLRRASASSTTAPGDASVLLALLGWTSVITYAWLFVVHAGTTWHSVDTIRDFHAASAIAGGTDYPVASQPWAARFQTPPAYLYLLALPIRLGADELDLMRIVGLVGLGAVVVLYRAVRPVLGANAAHAYLIVSFTISGALFAHSIGNSVLAMAASGLLLAALFRVSVRPGAGPAIAIIVLAALLPQFHLSALPLAVVALLTGLIRYRVSFLRIGPVLVLLALTVATGVWLRLVGGIAPEAVTVAVQPAQSAADLWSRVVDLHHWRALLTTLFRFVDALQPAPTLTESTLSILRGLVLLFTVASVGAGSVGIWSLLASGSLSRPSVARPLAIITIVSFFCAVAYVESWGIWYFDALWPWLAVCIAAGIARLVSSSQVATPRSCPWRRFAGASMVLALCSSCLVPPLIVHRALSEDGELAIDATGVFFSAAPPPSGASPLLQLSASNQLALRSSERRLTACQMYSAVGLFELYLRDFTLRDTWRGCIVPANGNPTAPPVLIVHTRMPYQEIVDWTAEVQAVHQGIRIVALPHQQVEIGSSGTNQTQGQVRLRYTLFRPAMIPAETLIRASTLSDAAPSRLRLALRCLAPIRYPASMFAADSLGSGVHSIHSDNVLGIHYYLLESDSAQPQFGYRVRTDINCDLMAYLVPDKSH